MRRRRYEQIFRKIIEEGITQRIFRNIDAPIAARTLLSATNWTCMSRISPISPLGVAANIRRGTH